MKFFYKIRESFNKFNENLFKKKLGLTPLLVKHYTLSYVVKSKLFKGFTFGVSRGVPINMTLFSLTMIFSALNHVTGIYAFNIVWYITVALFFISIYLNFFVTVNMKLTDILNYGNFTQIVGFKTAMDEGKSNYKLTESEKILLNTQLIKSNQMWTDKITKADKYNSHLVIFYPLIIIPILVIIFTLLTVIKFN